MRERALLALTCVCAAFAGGCGGEQLNERRAAAQKPDSVRELRKAALKPCPPSAWARRGGEDWAVAGVSCEAVGEFVLEHFAPHPGGTAQVAAGFTCHVQQYRGEYSPLHVTCRSNDGRAFRFVFS